MRKRRIERALLLGLVLSTSIYGTSFAAEMSISDFKAAADSNKNILVTEDTIVNGTGTSIGGDEMNNALTGYHITVNDDVKLDLNNLAGNHMDIKGKGDISIKLDHDAGANGGAIYINGNIEADKLTVDTSSTPNTKGIYTYGGDVNINVNELDIKANAHGIFTTEEATSDVNINNTQSVNIETNGAHGIVNSGNSEHINNISIKSDKENSEVRIFSHTAGISNNNSGGGIIDIKADTIDIETDNLYAVRGDHGDIHLEAKNNIISGGTSGVHTLNGDITITANENNTISTINESETLGAIYTTANGNGIIDITANNGNNTVNATTDGIHTEGNGNVNLTANGYNSVYSDKNAVYNSGSGNITISAKAPAGNESISLLANYDDYNNVLTAGENGVKSDSTGSTTVEADNDNIIAGTQNGILSDGEGTITVTAGNNNTIGQYTDESGITNISENGINVSNGTVTVTAENQNSIYGTKMGITATGAGSSVNLNGKINNIKVESDLDNYIYGIKLNNKAETKIQSIKDINIDIDTVGTHADAINEQNGSNLVLQADEGNIVIDVLTGAPNASGGNVDGIDIDGKDTTATLTAGKDIIITTKSSVVEQVPGAGANDVSAIRAQDGAVVTATANGSFYVNSIDRNSTNAGIRAQNDNANISIIANGINENGIGISINSEGKLSFAVYAQDGNNNLEATQGSIVLSSTGTENSNAIYNSAVSVGINTNIKANGDIILSANTDGEYIGTGYAAGIFNYSQGNYTGKTTLSGNNINIVSNGNNNTAYGILGQNGSDTENNVVTLDGNNINVLANSNKTAYGVLGLNSNINVTAKESTAINSSKYGIYLYNTNNTASNIDVISNNDNIIYGKTTGIYITGNNVTSDLVAQKGVNIVQSLDGIALRVQNGAQSSLKAENAYNVVFSGDATGLYSSGENTNVNLLAKGNTVVADTGVWGLSNGNIQLEATEANNEITTDTYGIYADSNANIDLTAVTNNNVISAGTVEDNEIGAGIGNKVAVTALRGSIVTLDAGTDNILAGTVYVNGNDINTTSVALTAGRNNVVQSSEHRVQEESGQIQNFVTALYARDNANVTLTAGDRGSNYIASEAGTLGADELERTVWAHKGADININGTTVISASNADVNTASESGMGNSKGVAVTAGTGVGVGEGDLTDFNMADELRSQVNINGDTQIFGDVASAYEGLVNINTDGQHYTRLQGNALAGNGGKLNINLGDDGVWYGRADDYGDASVMDNGHHEFFAPAFSSAISQGGQVNLTMGDNSTWFVEGQSWITSIDTTGAQNAMINLVDTNTDRNTTAHALTVYDLKGDATFEMSLDGNRDVSDMLYIKNADGNYDISLADPVTTADMYANGLNGLRFATVGAGSNVNFRAGTYDRGFFNVEYEVGSDSYDNNAENTVYNGESLDSEKPGNDTVDNFFDSTLAPGETPAEEQPAQDENQEAQTQSKAKVKMAKLAADNEVATLAEDAAGEENTAATQAEETASTGNVSETTNFKLIARKNETLSDAGKTILNMSRANYNQAVYMDTLNKRMGEARYLEEDQEGLWVRMRHDKTDKDTGFEISTNMYELGYDKKYESKDGNGYHRRGVALDYMDGDTSYDDIAGRGETNRKGIWVYDTWFGNKGHYTDYIAKWGHLENSFDLYTKSRGEKVSGEYNNDVYSISAEWGYKDKLNDNGWYLEPQLQMQYARVTGADYTTTQGTDVSVDGFDSLIARAGFRFGKDFGSDRKSTFYVKADVLHEFMGDQDITVRDKTTDGIARTIGYDNDGTWYTVGLGFSTMLSDHSYAFLDVEKVFGNDNDNSYQINGGVQWAL